MKILISNTSKEPIYLQIKNQIKNQIMNGTIKENTILPSIRSLAKDLSISVITTSRAYNDLEKEGFIKSIQGKGSIVLSTDSEMMKEQYLMKIEKSLNDALRSAIYAGITDDELIEILKNLINERND